MKVLLIVYDLYKEIGGGQTVYRNIVEQTPEVEFFYLRREEAKQALRPANAKPILVKTLAPEVVFDFFLPCQRYKKEELLHADSIAYTVADMEFDVVDVPDFYTFGSYLRMAFARWRVKATSIVLAMHGNISTSISMNWGNEGKSNVLQQILLENTQYVVADGVYSLSLSYMKEWQRKYKRKIHYIDPLCFVGDFINKEVVSWKNSSQTEKVGLYSIGRGEKRKGIDLFIDMVPWLHRGSYREVKHIGDICHTEAGSSNDLLRNIARSRDVAINLSNSLTHPQLQELFSQRNIVFLLPRYDTLNLLALEALFSGCPAVISSYAGVCEYLDTAHPGLPYVKFDMENFYSSIEQVQDLIDNYDVYRRKLTDYLVKNQIKEKPVLNMRLIYEQISKDISTYPQEVKYSNSYKIKTDAENSNEKKILYLSRFLYSLARELSKHLYLVTMKIIKLLPRKVKIFIKKRAKFLYPLNNTLIKLFVAFEGLVKFLMQEHKKVVDILKSVETYPEENMSQLYDRAEFLYSENTKVVYRCNLFLEVARLERLKGNDFLAAAYELRVLRLLGDDRMNLLPRVCGALRKHGKENEAEVAKLMYADEKPKEKMDRIYSYLQRQYERHRNYEEKSFSLMDDKRAEDSVKVSVIVSLYDADDKLTLFLSALSQQSLLRKGEVEILLIDSGSPGKEKAVLDEFLEKKPLNILYARTEERETIQAVWNRGILLSRGQYLVFLGVDETLYPQGFEVLADELDTNSEIDWVMSNSLLTQVGKDGLLEKDVMVYDRTGGQKTDTYLETCYLSYVGGMYRKSIHERFGYYDESFQAAGDTEFKNRVLPHIQVKFLPVTLGLFWDYPEDRKTASCLAEIEDLRAWYLHRTVGGIRYAFSQGSMSNVEALLLRSMNYRKSYCQHKSMDVEYAINLGTYIIFYVDGKKYSQLVKIIEILKQFLTSLRKIEFSEDSQVSETIMSQKVLRLLVLFQKLKQELCVLSSMFSDLSLEGFFHDNRYEQHFWFWSVLPYDKNIPEPDPDSQVLINLIPAESQQEANYALNGNFSCSNL